MLFESCQGRVVFSGKERLKISTPSHDNQLVSGSRIMQRLGLICYIKWASNIQRLGSCFMFFYTVLAPLDFYEPFRWIFFLTNTLNLVSKFFLKKGCIFVRLRDIIE